MSGLTLLIIGLASLGGIIAAAAYLGLKGWGLIKHGLRTTREVRPLADKLSGQAATLASRSDEMAASAAELTRNLERLQISTRRLQVAFEALREAADPYRRLLTYLGR